MTVEIRPLTERQAEALAFIRSAIVELGAPPTAREVADHFGVSPARGRHYLLDLEDRGHLTRRPNCSRGIVLTDPVMIPIAEVERRLALALGVDPAPFVELLAEVERPSVCGSLRVSTDNEAAPEPL